MKKLLFSLVALLPVVGESASIQGSVSQSVQVSNGIVVAIGPRSWARQSFAVVGGNTSVGGSVRQNVRAGNAVNISVGTIHTSCRSMATIGAECPGGN